MYWNLAAYPRKLALCRTPVGFLWKEHYSSELPLLLVRIASLTLLLVPTPSKSLPQTLDG
jgi:hypothetical protein